MIFGKRTNPEQYAALPKDILRVLDWAASHDLAQMECGMHPIDGDDLFVNVIEYTTKAPEERFWEAHRQYLDVHVPIAGLEQIDLAFLPDLQKEDYVEKDDFQPAQGDKAFSVTMQPETFLVCYPDDAHRTAVAVEGKPETVKKAIFKVRIA